MRRVAAITLLLFTACTSRFPGRTALRLNDHLPPPASADAIEQALQTFAIDQPRGVSAPIYDETLKDRGLTSWSPLAGDVSVSIGKSAFASWALLGSTLAHELEVHGRQNLLAISVKENLGIAARRQAEREAYIYEIEQARRFGLSDREVANIAATLAALDGTVAE